MTTAMLCSEDCQDNTVGLVRIKYGPFIHSCAIANSSVDSAKIKRSDISFLILDWGSNCSTLLVKRHCFRPPLNEVEMNNMLNKRCRTISPQPYAQSNVYTFYTSGTLGIFLFSCLVDPCSSLPCGQDKKCKVINGVARCLCNVGCTGLYKKSTCGSDGKTYASECELRKANCRSEENIDVEYYGNCKSK